MESVLEEVDVTVSGSGMQTKVREDL